MLAALSCIAFVIAALLAFVTRHHVDALGVLAIGGALLAAHHFYGPRLPWYYGTARPRP